MNEINEALKPLIIDIDTTKPDTRNTRKHNERNINAIKDSLRLYGQRKPIICNAKTKIIEAGNGLWTAAKSLGWTEIAAIFVDDDAKTAKSYGIMDNQAALLSEWDWSNLKDTFETLDDGSFDLTATGFTDTEIEDIMTRYFKPANIDDLLSELDMSNAVRTPIWAVIRTDASNKAVLDNALIKLEQTGIKVERNYED